MPKSLGAYSLTLCGVLLLCAPALAQSGTLIVLNKSEASVSLIDLESGEMRAKVDTDLGPHEAAVTPDGRWALVGNYGSRDQPGSSLTLIDIERAEVIRTIDLDGYRRPHGIQFLSDGRHAVVTAEDNRSLVKIDVESGDIVAAVATDQEISHMVAVTPDGSRAFVANIGSGSVTAIDLITAKRIAHVETGAGAEGIDITPDGSEVWLTNRAADTLSVLDASSLEILATVAAKSFPIRIKITPDGRTALVSCARSGDVAVFDTASRKETGRIAMQLKAGSDTEGRLFHAQFGESSVPVGILIHPAGQLAYVAHTQADVISVVDIEAGEVIARLSAGKEPDGLGYSPLTLGRRR